MMFSPHDEDSNSEGSDLEYQNLLEKGETKENEETKAMANVNFAPKITTEKKRQKKLKDDYKIRYGLAHVEPMELKVQKLKTKWTAEKQNYLEEIKKDDDRLVEQMISQLSITALDHADMLYMYEKFRELRQLLLRMRDMDIGKVFRVLIGKKETERAMDLLQFIQHDAICMQYVEEEDYKISGISDRDKNTILENLDLDTDNDEECDRWVSYIMFFSNPPLEWIRLRRRFERDYFKIIDSAVIQAMMNNDLNTLNTFMTCKIPKSLENSYENRFPTLVRADRAFSSYKRNSCVTGCEGHRGKLLLLMIRMRNNFMVKRCIKGGISVNSKCCTGQTRLLYWDNAKSKNNKATEEGEEALSEEDDEEEEEQQDSKRGRKKKTKITLRSAYEFETPLSTAVKMINIDAFNHLFNKANPMRCDDIAIRSAVRAIRPDSGTRLSADDNVYMFDKLHEKTNQMLKNSALFRQKGRVPPHYFTIALLYQAIVEDKWTAVRSITDALSNKPTNIPDKIEQLLRANDIKSSFPAGKLIKYKKGNKLAPATGSVMTKTKTGRSLFNRIRRKSRLNLDEDKTTVFLQGTGINLLKNDDLNEDLTFVLVSVIDKLIEQMMQHDANTHQQSVYAVKLLLTDYKLYLDRARFDRLLHGLVTVLQHDKPGDQAEVLELFANKQILDYLGFELTPGWDSRSVESFIKHEQIARLLQITGKRKNSEVLHDKSFMLELVFVQAARLELYGLMRELLENKVRPSEDAVEEAIQQIAIEGNQKCLEVVVKYFGKRHLELAFKIAVEYSNLEFIREILRLDTQMKQDEFSLTESFLSRVMFKSRNSKADKKTQNRNEIISLKTPYLLEIFFVYSDISNLVVKKILIRALDDQQRQINFDTAIDIVTKAESTLSKSKGDYFADRILLEEILSSHDEQYDDKPEKVQLGWLKFVLEVFKIAGRNDNSIGEEYNDKVVALLELNPQFDAMIDYASDDEVELTYSQKTERSGFL